MGYLVDEAQKECEILRAKVARLREGLKSAEERLARAEDRLLTAPAREAEEDKNLADLILKAQEEIKSLTREELELVLDACKDVLKRSGMTDLEINAFIKTSFEAAKGGKQ